MSQGRPIAFARAQTGVWDTVLEFGTYQHVTVDGEPVETVFDASHVQGMLDDFERHPESDVFYDKKHEVVEAMGDADYDDLEQLRKALAAWGDGHAMAWGNALCMVAGGQVVRYVPHPGAPAEPPTMAQLERDLRKRPPDGVYSLRSNITPRGADPKDGISSFRYTSPYFIQQRDGFRLLNLTCTNDPRMRGAALAMERGRPVAMTRSPAPKAAKERVMNEVQMRAGCMESDTPEQREEKMAAYALKLEEEKKAAMGDLEVVHKEQEMARQKMEEEKKAAEMARQKMEDEKDKVGAMERRVRNLEEKNGALETELRSINQQRAKEAQERAEAAKAQRAQDAKEFSAGAVAMGRIKPDHKGDVEKTRAWLEERYIKDPADAEDLLSKEGTFGVSERIAMTRFTERGAGKGAPDPSVGSPASSNIQDRMDAAMRTEMEKAQKEGKPINAAVAMERVKKINPSLHAEYSRR